MSRIRKIVKGEIPITGDVPVNMDILLSSFSKRDEIVEYFNIRGIAEYRLILDGGDYLVSKITISSEDATEVIEKLNLFKRDSAFPNTSYYKILDKVGEEKENETTKVDTTDIEKVFENQFYAIKTDPTYYTCDWLRFSACKCLFEVSSRILGVNKKNIRYSEKADFYLKRASGDKENER